MNKVQEIKQKYDLDAILRVISPSLERNVIRRREEEAKKRHINLCLSRKGTTIRLL